MKRRSLSDGPAVRRALAEFDSPPKDDGWKLLEVPPAAGGSKEPSGLHQSDSTQPEPSWRVVSVIPEAVEGNPAPSSADPPSPRAPAAAAPRVPGPSTGGSRQVRGARPKPPPPRRALIQTQLGLAPAPLAEESTRQPFTTKAAEKPTRAAPDRQSRELLELAKTQPGAPPFVDALARTHCAADTRDTPPADPPAAADIVATPANDQAVPHAARAALSSEAFATTQDRASDLVIPGLEPSWFSRLRLPPGTSAGKLLGLGTLALLSASVPIALLGLGISLLFGDAATAAPVAVEAQKKPHVEASAPPRPTPALTKQAPRSKPQSTAANLPKPASAEPEASATITGIPWTVRASNALPPCQSLANSDTRGPPGFLLQKAIKTGQQELIRGNIKAAHIAFCEASLLISDNATVLHGLAQVLLMQSDLESALTTVDRLLELEPKDRRARELRGDILVRMGRISEAREAWFRAAGASRASATLIANLVKASRNSAEAAFKTGDLMRTDRMLRRVIALEPKDVDASAKLAAVLQKQGHTQAAKSWLAYAETLDPGHARVQAVKVAFEG